MHTFTRRFWGVFEELTGLKWECKEMECMAQGKEFCLFELEKKG
ncbi:MAG: V4R domain-containing protein [Aquificaceae bacterium]